MPIANGNFSFNTGRDCSIVVMGGNGGRIDIPLVTGFESSAEYASIASEPLTGQTLNAKLPKGWKGSIMIDRGSPGVDQFFAAAEQAWLNGGSYQASTLFQYITEADGSTSTFQYNAVALELSDAGNYKGDAIVTQKINFMANSRTIV